MKLSSGTCTTLLAVCQVYRGMVWSPLIGYGVGAALSVASLAWMMTSYKRSMLRIR